MFRRLLVILVVLFLVFLSSETIARPIVSPSLLLSKYGKYAKWINAQAKHETGNYTSPIYKENNNLFGMKLAKVRNTNAIGENRGHAVYQSKSDSINDLLMWFNAQQFPTNLTSVDQYVRELKNRGYFTDSYSNYLNGVKSWIR